MIRGRATLRLFTLTIWLAAATPATSGDLRLEPVSLTLGPGEEATSLWLSNTGRQPLQAQVRLFSWTQDGGGEVLQATRELAVSPPLLEVPPLGRQRVRVVRLAGSTISAETAYRLVVDELPPDSPPAAGGQASLLRYSIPVFIQPSAAAKPRLSARIDEDAAGNRLLRLQNSGDRHARVAALLRQCTEKGYAYDQANALARLERLDDEGSLSLMVELSRWPETVEAAGQSLEPHLVAQYLRELAYAFHTWYANTPVLVEDADLRDARLALALAVRQALANGLDLLGVSAPERM